MPKWRRERVEGRSNPRDTRTSTSTYLRIRTPKTFSHVTSSTIQDLSYVIDALQNDPLCPFERTETHGGKASEIEPETEILPVLISPLRAVRGPREYYTSVTLTSI